MADEAKETTAEEIVEKTYEQDFEEFANASSNKDSLGAAPVEEKEDAVEAVGSEEEKPEEKKEDAPDELALAKEEAERYKKELEDMTHRYNSDAGRVSAFQKQINEQNEKIEKLSKKEIPTQAQVAEALENEDDFQELMEEFPKAAPLILKKLKAVDEIKAELNEKMAAIDGKIAPVTERVDKQDAKTYAQEQFAALEKPRDEGGLGYPDWRELCQSDDFKKWVPKQHEAIFKLYDSTAAADVAAAFDLFRREFPLKAKPEDSGDDEKRALEAQRKKRLETNVHTEGKQGGPAGTAPDDYDAAFEFFAKKSDTKRRKEGLI